MAEVVTPSPIPEVIPFEAASDGDRDAAASAPLDVKAALRALVDLRLAGRLTPEEYQRRRENLLSRL